MNRFDYHSCRWPIKVLLAAPATLLLVLLIMVPAHWGKCMFAPVEIEPVEGTTTELVIVEHHWFKSSTRTRVHAKSVQMDLGPYPTWMIKGKDGSWSPAFRFETDWIEPEDH